MARVNYDNLTIFEASEVQFENNPLTGHLIVFTGNPHPEFLIPVTDVHEAIVKRFGIDIQEGGICVYGFEYLVLVEAIEDATRIINASRITVGNIILRIRPWTPEYGSIKMALNPQIPHSQTPARQMQPLGPKEALHVSIAGIPPHLFGKDFVVRRIFAKCQCLNIKHNEYNLTISFDTYASREDIPMDDRVAVSKREGLWTFLYIWDIDVSVSAPIPLDKEALLKQQEELPAPDIGLQYMLYPIPKGDQGAGPSLQGGSVGLSLQGGGAHGLGHQQMVLLLEGGTEKDLADPPPVFQTPRNKRNVEQLDDAFLRCSKRIQKEKAGFKDVASALKFTEGTSTKKAIEPNMEIAEPVPLAMVPPEGSQMAISPQRSVLEGIGTGFL